ncbi:proline-rich protein 36-like [Ischnura elegans]|uniref:proline-rich protein 36-like n=1 Tax=Ischnura elegans TaxID=197161 RepID=UPI001ED874B7|nr:proline-rich protein 36-like [Ischnura elegans]
MREALEAAEQDAQKQRKKRSGHRTEEKIVEPELNKDHPGIDVAEQNNNYAVSSCCPILTEGTPKAEQGECLVDDMGSGLPVNMKLEGNMTRGRRLAADYPEVPYHSPTAPVAPFKISIPESSMHGGPYDVGGDGSDPRQGGVLIVGRDVYLLPYVNTDVLAPQHFGGGAFAVGPGGGMESIGSGMLGSADQYDFRREWISGNQRVRPSKDVATQTEPSTQGPLLLLLRLAGPDDSQPESERRSSADDYSSPDNDKEGKGRAFSEGDGGTASNDCCFCQKTRSQSQPSCSKGPSQDCQQKQPQQLDQRPKWGANRPTRRYTTQSEKDPHYSCRNANQKRPPVGRSKREVSEAEEASEDAEQVSKPPARVKSKAETSATNASSSGAPTRNTSTRKKKESSKKKSEKAKEAEESVPQASQQPVPQSPLPVLVPPRTIAPKRVQVVKPSLSFDQDLMGGSEYQTPEPTGSRAHLPYFSPQQFSPMQMFPDCKHLPPPVLSPHQRSALSPTRFTPMPLAPIRLSPSPTHPIRPPPSHHSPMPTSSRQTQTPLPPSSPPPSAPLPPPPPKSNRNCGSPPVPAVLSKLRREQAKSPPRQFSFISTAPERERPPQPPPSRKESRSGTPSLKPQSESSKQPSPRPESKNTVVVITPSEDAGRRSPLLKPKCPVPKPLVENSGLLTTPRENISRASYVSCPSRSSAHDNSNALMMVTSTEDISVGSPAPPPLFNSFSMVEVDGNGSVVLMTHSDEISVGVDSRSNVTLSRASQISAEGIPDGFWEDFESSAQISSSLAEVSVATSIPEDFINVQKEGLSARCMEQGDETQKKTVPKELGSKVNQLDISSERQGKPTKSEGLTKDINKEQKEGEEGVVESKNTDSVTATEKDNGAIDPKTAAKNEVSVHQEARKDTGKKIGEVAETKAGSVSTKPSKNGPKQETNGCEGEETIQRPTEVEPLNKNKTVTPDVKVERKRSQEVDGNSYLSTAISAVEKSCFEQQNEDSPNAMTLAPEAEAVLPGEMFNKDIEAMTELERNQSCTEVVDVAKASDQMDSSQDCEDEKIITSEGGQSPRIEQGAGGEGKSSTVSKSGKEVLSREKLSPGSVACEIKETNVESKSPPEGANDEKETLLEGRVQTPRVGKNATEIYRQDKELSPGDLEENKERKSEVTDTLPLNMSDETTPKLGKELELPIDSKNEKKETELKVEGMPLTHEAATDASSRRDSHSHGKVELLEAKCDGDNEKDKITSKIDVSSSGDSQKKE